MREALLQSAREARPQHENLLIQTEACDRHLDYFSPPSWYQAPNPLEACIVRGRFAMFDRDVLRAALRQLMLADGPNVLVVRGPSGTGCSHSLELVVHLNDHLRAFRLVTVDLEDTPTEIDPQDFITDMALQLGVATRPPARHAQTARWNADLISWFVGHVEERAEPVWVVVDGFDHHRPRDEIVELLTELVDRAERKCLHLRVILLGWEELLPPRLESRILYERIGTMGPEVLNEFFTQFLQHQDQPPSSDGVRRAVERLTEEVSADLAGDLHRISQGAVAIARSLAAPPRSP